MGIAEILPDRPVDRIQYRKAGGIWSGLKRYIPYKLHAQNSPGNLKTVSPCLEWRRCIASARSTPGPDFCCMNIWLGWRAGSHTSCMPLWRRDVYRGCRGVVCVKEIDSFAAVALPVNFYMLRSRTRLRSMLSQRMFSTVELTATIGATQARCIWRR